MSTTATRRWTTADLAALSSPVDDTRYEIIDGALIVSKQPDFEHQYTGGEVFVQLHRWSRASGAGTPIFAPGIIFPDDDNAAPDIAWVQQDRLRHILGADRKLHAAPDLVVEVLSPGPENEARDRESKLRLYARQGVRDYWILDWRRCAYVFRRDGNALVPAPVLQADDTLESPILPGFSCHVGDLFPVENQG